MTSKRGTEGRRDVELIVLGEHFSDEGDLGEVVVTVFDDAFDVAQICSVPWVNEGGVEGAVVHGFVHGFDFGGKLFGIV